MYTDLYNNAIVFSFGTNKMDFKTMNGTCLIMRYKNKKKELVSREKNKQ